MKIFSKVLFTVKAKIYKQHLSKKLNIIFEPHSGTDRNTIFEGDNYIGTHNYIQNCKLGRGSIIARDSTFRNACIGRYSSIGPETRLITSMHPSHDYVSTHQSFFSLHPITEKIYISKQIFREEIESDENGYQITIGNDVWIGQGATIMGGIQIGDGAIVATGAVVVKDIAPYSIVGGVPAKVIGYRFEKDDIEWLLNFRWWDKEEDWLKSHADMFSSIDLLKKQVENRN